MPVLHFPKQQRLHPPWSQIPEFDTPAVFLPDGFHQELLRVRRHQVYLNHRATEPEGRLFDYIESGVQQHYGAAVFFLRKSQNRNQRDGLLDPYSQLSACRPV